MTKIKDALQAIPMVVYIHGVNGEPITDVTQLLSSEFLEIATQISAEKFKKAIGNGSVSEHELLNIITKTNNKISANDASF